MFPRAGGNYVYLREAFHPLAGFLVGWLSFFAIMSRARSRRSPRASPRRVAPMVGPLGPRRSCRSRSPR